MTRTLSKPDLSIIIPTYQASETIVDCLRSISKQKTQKSFEVIVIDSAGDKTIDLVKENFPSVIGLSFSRRKFAGDARNVGIAYSRAPIIAFMDADCVVEENWIDEVMRAHEGAHGVVGGVILNGQSKTLTGWAYYFCEFNLWLPDDKVKEIPEIAGCCLSMKRDVFDKYGPFLVDTYCSDTALHWKMQKDGMKVLFVPSIKVYHVISCSVRNFLSHLFFHRRHFARLMVREKKIPRLLRFIYCLISPLMPPVFYLAIALRVMKSGYFFKEFVSTFPLVSAGMVARAYGEFIGFMET